MGNDKPITLRTYYARFKSLSGLLASVLTAGPFLSKLLPNYMAAYAFPPLGSADPVARVGGIALAGASTYLAFFSKATPWATNKWRITTAMCLGAACFLLYLGLFLRLVRTIEIPSRDTAVQVSVGYARSEFARSFGDVSDWQLLLDRGTAEEEIWRLWTPRSIIASRLLLFASYEACICSFVLAFSWGVLDEFKDQLQESHSNARSSEH